MSGRIYFSAVLSALLMVACSSSNVGHDLNAADATGDVVADALVTDAGDTAGGDVVRPDAVGDLTPDLVGDGQVIEDAADVTGDAGDVVDVDVAPPVPWYEQLAPTGQKVRDIFGVASHMDAEAGANPQREFEFSKYDELGGVRMRRGLRWNRVEPNQGEWHFEQVSGAVEGAVASNTAILPMLCYGVTWALADGENYGSLDIVAFANYAGAMAAQFCDSTKEYEIWNEENITRFWHLPPDPAKYADMLALSATAIRTACPGAKVVLGGLTSYDDSNNMFETWGFLRRMLEVRPDICDSFDVLGLHPYTFFQYDTPEYDEVIDSDLKKRGQTAMTLEARAILSEFGCPDKDIYYTELGWPSYDLSKEQVARYAVRSMLITARDSVEGWYWYTFWDDPPESSGIRPHENYFGLFEYPGDDDSVRTPKPAWNALISMLGVVGQGRFALDVGAAMDLPNDVYVLAFVDDDQNLSLAMWDGREQPDVSWGTAEQGGPDTTYDLELPLPESTVSTALYDQAGLETASLGAGPSVPVVLTPTVQYLKIHAGID